MPLGPAIGRLRKESEFKASTHGRRQRLSLSVRDHSCPAHLISSQTNELQSMKRVRSGPEMAG
jgi:hypothetical protein